MANKDSGDEKPKRFRIAFSFSGDKRDFVLKVARILADRFGEEKILYDKFHEAEFANADLAFDLPALYKSDSDLIVAVFCPDYDRKEWCGLEWRAIFSIIKEGGSDLILLSRFDHVDGKGLFGLAGFIELDSKTPEEFVTLILQRLALNEGFPKDHYTKPSVASGDTPRTSIPHNLPSLQPFFGREEELRKIADALDPKHRSWGTLIDGDGGRGKTSLAVFAAYQVPPENFERIVFVSIKQQQQDDARLRDLSSMGFKSWMEMLGEVARILDLKAVTQAPEAERARTLSQQLEGRRTLLVLDNLETLSDAEQDQLFSFLDRLPEGNKALLTSRRFVGTTVQALDLPVLDQPTALQLLREVAGHNSAFAASSESERIDLFRETEGNALLLRWTAGQVGRGRCRNIVDALDYLRSCPKDNNPLEFIFGDVFTSLSEPEIALLAALSHVSQPMRREDLVVISDVAEEDASARLKELINRSIITSDVQETRFALVPLVADFLRAKEPYVLRETRDRLEVRAYRLVAENGFRHYDRFPILDAAWPTVAAALPRFLAGENGRLQTVCGWLVDFLNFTGRWDEWLALSCDAEKRAVADGDSYEAGWRAYQAGCVYYRRGQSSEVLASADRAEAHWREANADARECGVAIQLRGIGHTLAGDYAAAIIAFREVVDLDSSLDSESPDVSIDLNALANAERFTGEIDAAERDYREALRIARAVDYHEGIAYITGNLAALALDRNDWAAAEALARDALLWSEKVGRLELIAADCVRLGLALVRQGKKEDAFPYCGRAVEIFQRLGSKELAAAQQTLAECES
ncbi:MAG TPA: tetratricopeptide repeat protein [Pyrinomonadaceae bacterium]|jgi:tetratricopeptide (TPR) repeat protein|nr:tetratricopeptide repeat protein [Pyrinomonadaceae bacterium]